MTTHTTPPQNSTDEQLALLIGELTNKFQAGESIDLEWVIRDHPQWAEQLDSILPAMQALAELAHGPDGPSVSANMQVMNEGTHGLLGDFKICREIGRGGMGIVYEAEQMSLGRRVALKVLPFAAVLNRRQLQRFKNEAQAAAALHHPNIVPVHGIGCERGVHYYAMQYIEGNTLADVIRDLQVSDPEKETSASSDLTPNPSSHRASGPRTTDPETDESHSHATGHTTAETKRVLQAVVSTERSTKTPAYFRSVAQAGLQAAVALEHAHAVGVVHRDIKPSNLLIDDEDNLWVTDFGLALIETDVNLTTTGDLVGTLRYMSPEQAVGNRTLDHRTDIYSLGITLYELATLKPAYQESDRHRLLQQVADAAPVPPRKINSRMPRDLETVILKAISKQPDERYATAQQMADDLQSFLDHEPVQARRPGPVQRVGKWARRNWVPVTTALMTLSISLAATVVATTNAYRQERQQRQVAERERSIALTNLQLALDAVDEMYAEVATTWLATDTALSSTQHRFLQNAIGIYDRVVMQTDPGEKTRRIVATTYFRMGRIHYRLGQYSAAREAFENAIAIHEVLPQGAPQTSRHRVQLASSYNGLANALDQLGLRHEALDALDRAHEYAAPLAAEFPEFIDYQVNLALNDQNRADTLLMLGRLDEAERLARTARDRFRELARESHRNDISLNRMRCGAILSHVLLRQGRYEDALAVGHAAIGLRNQLKELVDHRDVIDIEADLHEQLGQIHFAAGQVVEAKNHFRRSLEARRITFKARVSPVRWALSTVYKGKFRDQLYEEPGPFCDYVNTQLRLATALRELGKVHAAELVAGEAYQTSQNLAVGHDGDEEGALRYRVARANSCAEVAALLTDLRPEEAARARAMAATIWREAIETFPDAAGFRSGVHGEQNDLQWFLETYPGENVEQAPPLPSVDLGHSSVFGHHVSGVMFFQTELWEMAIDRLQKSAELRVTDDAYDEFYIAMAYWHLEQPDKARQWYERAVAGMTKENSADPELDAIRKQASELLAFDAPVNEGELPKQAAATVN